MDNMCSIVMYSFLIKVAYIGFWYCYKFDKNNLVLTL
jgi:hypothetical protein